MTQRRPPARPSGARRTTPVPAARRPATRRSAFWRWRRGLFVVGLVGVAATGGITSVVFNINLPPEDPLRQTSFVCGADVTSGCGPDNAIATFSAEEDRINVPLEEVPQVVVDAVLATEDRDFFEHGGVDPVGIARALYNDVRGRGVQQGGSTITQQYVKNVYLNSERSITRKVKEAILAVKLERELDKEQILERYLNTIYFGRGAYGVGAASRAYFGEDIRDVGLNEAAYLAGLIRAPEAADALAHPEEATRRRDLALDALKGLGKIDDQQLREARAVEWDQAVIPRRDRTKLQIDPALEAVGGAYFIEEVRQELEDKYGAAVLYGGGLRVYVTLDQAMQEDAWKAVTSTLNQPDDPAGALVAVDDRGEVKAMMGGLGLDGQQPWARVNLAMGKQGGGSGRAAGSSFKPFALAAAVKAGVSLNSKFNAPAEITLPKADNGKDYVVGNYEDAEQGILDLVDAMRVSSNTVFVQLANSKEVGPQRVADMAKDMGVSADLAPNASLVLGSSDVSPLDMAVGFSTLANRGLRNDPELIRRIEQVDDDGGLTVLEESRPSEDRVLTESESDQVTYALRRVVTEGTGRAANYGKSVAGKTGTTDEYRDAWFVGYTPKLTAAVWMGFPNARDPDNPDAKTEIRYMDDVHGIEVTGGSLPTEIWKKFMRNATEGEDQGSFTTPKSFPGKVINGGLVLTTSSTTPTTLVDGSTTTTLPDGVTIPTFPGSTTSSTAPGPTSTTTTVPLPECTKPGQTDPRFPNGCRFVG